MNRRQFQSFPLIFTFHWSCILITQAFESDGNYFPIEKSFPQRGVNDNEKRSLSGLTSRNIRDGQN